MSPENVGRQNINRQARAITGNVSNAALAAAARADYSQPASKRSQSVESLLNRIPKLSAAGAAPSPKTPAWSSGSVNVSMTNPSSKASTDGLLTVTMSSTTVSDSQLTKSRSEQPNLLHLVEENQNNNAEANVEDIFIAN